MLLLDDSPLQWFLAGSAFIFFLASISVATLVLGDSHSPIDLEHLNPATFPHQEE